MWWGTLGIWFGNQPKICCGCFTSALVVCIVLYLLWMYFAIWVNCLIQEWCIWSPWQIQQISSMKSSGLIQSLHGPKKNVVESIDYIDHIFSPQLYVIITRMYWHYFVQSYHVKSYSRLDYNVNLILRFMVNRFIVLINSQVKNVPNKVIAL